MVSERCKTAVKDVLKKHGLHFIIVDLGEVEIMENLSGDLFDFSESRFVISRF